MPHDTLIDVWSVEGRFQHLIYSPRGEHEGVLIDTDGVPTQFVFDKHDPGAAAAFAQLEPGQRITVEGSERPASPKGEGAHVVYDFHRLSEVDGRPVAPVHDDGPVEGRVLTETMDEVVQQMLFDAAVIQHIPCIDEYDILLAYFTAFVESNVMRPVRQLVKAPR